jgi:hypothetical protein
MRPTPLPFEKNRRQISEPFFGSLPTDGIWSSVGLTRAQFLWLIALSTALFVFIDGPLWEHLRDTHFNRILFSYAFIPPAVAAALRYNGKLRWMLLVAATVMVGLVKLLLTAVVLVALGLLQSGSPA